jgi:hypothetical protein
MRIWRVTYWDDNGETASGINHRWFRNQKEANAERAYVSKELGIKRSQIDVRSVMVRPTKDGIVFLLNIYASD